MAIVLQSAGSIKKISHSPASSKEAVGSKLVWKYRLKFYASLEAFLQSQDNTAKAAELTQADLDLMAQMREVV